MTTRLLALALCAASAAHAQAQAQPQVQVQVQDQSARDLTIRLFDTDRLTTLTLTPLSPATTWKPCPSCAPRPLTTPITATLDRRLTINGSPATTVTITGSLRAETAAHRRAEAAAQWTLDTDKGAGHDSLRLRVTLPSERYVAAVLTAEAPADEPPASLRALAIVVRSFALTHAEDLSDSTRTQAMRLAPISPAIHQAVLDTAGETLWLHASQVPAYFTQSSGGATESSASAWGGPSQPWLPAQPDPASDRTPSQWHTEIPLSDLRAALTAEGFPLQAPIRTITILSRTPSGRAARLRLDQLELPAPTFRFAVNRSLGWSRLRSDLYTVQVSGQTATFDGRGYGHGVGLSQSGARTLALAGRDTAAILHLYLPNTTIRITPSDTGWQTQEAAGWTLISTAPNPTLLAAGNAAWRRAQELLPPQTPVHPEVRLFPTTPLFRSATSQPGWTLAATHAPHISLQPPTTLRSVALTPLLLHEMLHVLVETEATAPLPLWFQEGFVEALADPNVKNTPGQSIAQTEAQLAHPASLAEAQRAHREAAALVRRLATIYSPDTMRTWLRRGLPADALDRAGIH